MKKILVAEDEFDLLRSIQILLIEEGYEVLTCSNGRDALRLVREKTPDLIITDVMMPHMSGLDVLKALNEDQTSKGLKTIVMSAARVRESAEAFGCSTFLPKPFTIEQLITAVDTALKCS